MKRKASKRRRQQIKHTIQTHLTKPVEGLPETIIRALQKTA